MSDPTNESNRKKTEKKIERSEEEWRQDLSPDEFEVCRMKGTERAFTGEYTDCKTPGVYHCRCCGADLFHSDTKFDSGSGWPSFWQPIEADGVNEIDDLGHGMRRVEVTKRCHECTLVNFSLPSRGACSQLAE